ncbi:hypothetical protein [Spartinivicinus ruber]|uniref:hypothetical protein n=1 Tax=Spartinivicinus ruber TaxID=2683272 RepID=UPI0013D892AD|nr:hypothetical protein [Spartinivicinus ruber]
MRGAGGTSGGIGLFFIGLIMMCGGFYLLFNAISVRSTFGMGMGLYSFSGWGANFTITNGMVMIPFMFGIGLVFYDAKNIIGWVLFIGALVALIFGVITSIHFSLKAMSAFDLITILVLSIGGLGLFLRSLKSF